MSLILPVSLDKIALCTHSKNRNSSGFHFAESIISHHKKTKEVICLKHDTLTEIMLSKSNYQGSLYGCLLFG